MKGRSLWCGLVLLGYLTLTPAVGVGQSVVVPNSLAATEGNASNAYPFHCADAVLSSQRYQQVYLGSEVGTMRITAIAFRQDDVHGAAFGPTAIPNVTIMLSTTTAAVDGLSLTFADNVGVDETTVFSGTLTLSSATCSSTPCPFDILIPLTTAFPFDASAGNLLLDVTISTCVLTTYFDAESSTDSVSRVFSEAGGANSPIGVSINPTLGLVTRFTASSAASAPALSAWGIAGMIVALFGLGILAERRRSRRNAPASPFLPFPQEPSGRSSPSALEPSTAF